MPARGWCVVTQLIVDQTVVIRKLFLSNGRFEVFEDLAAAIELARKTAGEIYFNETKKRFYVEINR